MLLGAGVVLGAGLGAKADLQPAGLRAGDPGVQVSYKKSGL